MIGSIRFSFRTAFFFPFLPGTLFLSRRESIKTSTIATTRMSQMLPLYKRLIYASKYQLKFWLNLIPIAGQVEGDREDEQFFADEGERFPTR